MERFFAYALIGGKLYLFFLAAQWSYIGIAEWIHYARVKGAFNGTSFDEVGEYAINLLDAATDEWKFLLKLFKKVLSK